MLAAYGALSAFVYGFLLNLSFWPFATRRRHAAVVRRRARRCREPAPVLPVHARDVDFGWDTGRAITNAVAIVRPRAGGARACCAARPAAPRSARR